MSQKEVEAEYIEKILRAQVYDIVEETPLDYAERLSSRLGRPVHIKREDLQAVFSFKLRGAHNKITTLDPEERMRGVIAASAGNHAQGVAFSAQRLGIDALIVMPSTTPAIKLDAVKSLGARIEICGETYDQASARAFELAEKTGMTFIHAFDDPEIIAGQGTIGMELLRQHPKAIHAIFIPVGGGGLIAGIGTYIKYVRPEIKIIGVEPDDAASLREALAQGKPVRLGHVGLFADGAAVGTVGHESFRVARYCVDEVITVTTDETCAAIRDIFEDTRVIAEPSGALALAGLKKYARRPQDSNSSLIALQSGANINFDRLRHIAERAELGEAREGLLAVTLPEPAGSFLAFCRHIGRRTITEFNYRYTNGDHVPIFVGLELSGGEDERRTIISRLEGADYPVIDLSENEAAKLHIRHMIGGHAATLKHERLYRFEFPERPGALLDFLETMSGRWNISLFHYRNHGAAFGRVLMGVIVHPGDRAQFDVFLTRLGYPYYDESENPAYRLFAGSGAQPESTPPR